MKVTTEITVYEINEEPVPLRETRVLIVRSQGSSRDFVVLENADISVVVSAQSLRLAIENATNWR